MDINCWIFLAAGILVVAWMALAGRYLQQKKPLPGWLAPDWIFGDPTCDPTTAPLTTPARCAIWFGALVGAVFALLIFGLAFKPSLELENLIPLAFVSGIAALCGWWGYHGANAATRYVMVRRATPFEVFIAGAAGAVVSVWFHSGAGSGSSSSSSSSSSDSDRSSGGGRFGGGGASGSW